MSQENGHDVVSVAESLQSSLMRECLKYRLAGWFVERSQTAEGVAS